MQASNRIQKYSWNGEQGTADWLRARTNVAAFIFSEVPSWLGTIGEVFARSLPGGTGRLNLHLWTRVTPYRGDSGIPQASWVRAESALMRMLRVKGGGHALAARLAEMAPGRVQCFEPAGLDSPDAQAVVDMLASYRAIPLRDVLYKGSDAGWAVYGNLSNLTMSAYATDLVPDDQVEKMLLSYAAVYDAAVETLRRQRPDAVVLFNGRWLHEWAAREAADHLEIPVIVLETGRDESHFSTYAQSAHDRHQFTERFRWVWETRAGMSETEAHETAHRWFTSRRTSPASDNPFVRLQVAGVVPAPVDGTKRIVYYTSSLDELLGAGRSWLSPFGSQEEILERLVALAAKDDSVQLIIRVHPHTLLKNSRDQAFWAEFERESGDHVVVIGPDSAVDSYALAESSQLVLSMCSTMGLEAAYWGVPSATVGPALYDTLNVTTVVRDLDDAFSVEVSDEERDRRRERALQWGLHEATLGTPYAFYDPARPYYQFAGKPLARRGPLQALMPESLSRRRGRRSSTRMRQRWDKKYTISSPQQIGPPTP